MTHLDYILPVIWYCIIGAGILMYVILDGFTQGVGILMPFAHNMHERNMMMSVILPTWDGNQTWLVFGTAALYGAFPAAFATLMPLIYLPIMTMVIAILFRGVAFEYRMKSTEKTHLWDRVIFISSFLVAFMQGNILGAFVEGFHHEELLKNYFAWHSPFSYLTGMGVVFGYALLGATRIILKLDGPLQYYMYKVAKVCLILVSFFMVTVSLATPFVHPEVFNFWFDIKKIPALAILPITTGILFLWCWHELNSQNNDKLPYILSYLMFICGYIGLGLSTFPYLVPRTMDIWQAASPTSTLIFMTPGALIMLPCILVYTFYAYKIFKGKVHDPISY